MWFFKAEQILHINNGIQTSKTIYEAKQNIVLVFFYQH